MNINEVKEIVESFNLKYSGAKIDTVEKFVLSIEADYNDGDYHQNVTVFKVTQDFNLEELLRVLVVLRKLQQAPAWTGDDSVGHMRPLYDKLTDEDVKVLSDYDVDNFNLFDEDENDSKIRAWFPEVEDYFDWGGREHIKGNHSLISIKLQYVSSNGEYLNVEF